MFKSTLLGGSFPTVDLLAADLVDLDTHLTSTDARKGRIGPDKVSIDLDSIGGTVEVNPKQLHVIGTGNFNSVRANVCLFSGKWMYEVTLGSGGVQQLGWTTINTKWTAEEGVGDHMWSYAYDGNRVKKWNVNKQNYGKEWSRGDVIGCGIDMTKGTISFYQNGECLGVAFEKLLTIHTVEERVMDCATLAYFPAISLSHNESSWINFGQQPFVYPVPDYRPIQIVPDQILYAQPQRQYICACLLRLTQFLSQKVPNELDIFSGGWFPLTADVWNLYDALFLNLVEYSCVEGEDGVVSVMRADEWIALLVYLFQTDPNTFHSLLRHFVRVCCPPAGLPKSSTPTSYEALVAFTVSRLCYFASILPLSAQMATTSTSSSVSTASLQPPPTFLAPLARCHQLLEEIRSAAAVSQNSSASAAFAAPVPVISPSNVYLKCLDVLLENPDVATAWVHHPSTAVDLDLYNVLSIKMSGVEELNALFPQIWWSGGHKDVGKQRLSDADKTAFMVRIEVLAQQSEVASVVAVDDLVRRSIFTRLRERHGLAVEALLALCVKRCNPPQRNALGNTIDTRTNPGDVISRIFFIALDYFHALPVPGGSDPCFGLHTHHSGKDNRERMLPLWPCFSLLRDDDAFREVQRCGGLLSYLRKEFPIRCHYLDEVIAKAESLNEKQIREYRLQDRLIVDADHSSRPYLPHDDLLAVCKYHKLFQDLTHVFLYGVKPKLKLMLSTLENRGKMCVKLVANLDSRDAVHILTNRDQLYSLIRRSAWEYCVFMHGLQTCQLVEFADQLASIFTQYDDSMLFRYIPSHLLEILITATLFVARISKQFPTLLCTRPASLLFLVTHLYDLRIAVPDVKDLILSAIASLLDPDEGNPQAMASVLQTYDSRLHAYNGGEGSGKPGLSEHLGLEGGSLAPREHTVEDHPIRRFFRGLFKCFLDQNGWVGVIGIVARFYSGLGFGCRIHELENENPMQEYWPGFLPPWEVDDGSKTFALARISTYFGAEFHRYCLDHMDEANEFLNNLLNHLNWSMSELAVSLSEQRRTGAFVMSDIAPLKRCAVIFDLTSRLLRILEFVTDWVRFLFVGERDPSLAEDFRRYSQCQYPNPQTFQPSASSQSMDVDEETKDEVPKKSYSELVAEAVSGEGKPSHSGDGACGAGLDALPPFVAQLRNGVERQKINSSLVAEILGHALHRFTCGEGAAELNRVIGTEGHVLTIVKKTELLAPVAGILLNMVLDNGDGRTSPENVFVKCLATNTDRRWELENLEYLKTMDWSPVCGADKAASGDNGGGQPQPKPTPSALVGKARKLDTLLSSYFNEVLAKAAETNTKLQEQVAECESMADDNEGGGSHAAICDICCSEPQDRAFVPCGHRSCAQCIARHLLNSKRCFFCNADIQDVRPTTPLRRRASSSLVGLQQQQLPQAQDRSPSTASSSMARAALLSHLAKAAAQTAAEGAGSSSSSHQVGTRPPNEEDMDISPAS